MSKKSSSAALRIVQVAFAILALAIPFACQPIAAPDRPGSAARTGTIPFAQRDEPAPPAAPPADGAEADLAEVERQIALLKSDDAKVRQGAIAALGKMGPKTKVVVPALLQAYDNFLKRLPPTSVIGAEWKREEQLIIQALKGLGTAAIDPLNEALRQRKGEIRDRFVIDALAAVGPAATPSLIPLLSDPDPIYRRIAIWALADMKPGDPRAVAPLIHLLAEDKDQEVREAAAATLGRLALEPDKAVPALVEAGKEPSLRAEVAKSLSQYGPPAKEAVPALIEWLGDKEWLVRDWAASALASIRPPANMVVPALTAALQHDESASYVASALGQYGPEAAAAAPRLRELLDHKDAWVRLHAAVALSKVDPKSGVAPAAAVLEKLSNGSPPDTLLHKAAVDALSQIRKPPPAAQPVE